MVSKKSKWLKVSEVAAHFGVSDDTIRNGNGMFGLLEIARPTERTLLVTRESFERLDGELERMACKKAGKTNNDFL